MKITIDPSLSYYKYIFGTYLSHGFDFDNGNFWNVYGNKNVNIKFYEE